MRTAPGSVFPVSSLPPASRAATAASSAEPTLLAAAAILAFCGIGFALLGLTDGREIAGASPWAKPMKFSASLSIHLATLAAFWPWLAAGFREGPFGSAIRRAVIAASVFELVYIAFQASRGAASHYNVAEPFPALMYQLMGVGAVVIVSGTAAAGIAALAVREEGARGVLRRAIGVGLTLSGTLGLATGALLSINEGRLVGSPLDAAAVWPLFGWSREVGDLRIAHFIGLHAAQALPLVGLAAIRFVPDRAGWVVAAAASALIAATAAVAALALAGVAPI